MNVKMSAVGVVNPSAEIRLMQYCRDGMSLPDCDVVGVEGREAPLDICSETFAGAEVQVSRVQDHAAALQRLNRGSVDVILLQDCGVLGDRNQLIMNLRETAPDVPVVVLSQDADPAHAVDAIRAGAQDYVVCGDVNAAQLTRRILCAVERVRRENTLVTARDDMETKVRRFTHELIDIGEALRDEVAGREQVARSLVRAHAEIDQVFQTAAGGMRLVDKEFNVFRANESMAQIAGMDTAQMVGRPCYETFPGSLCGTPDCTLKRVLAGQQVAELEVMKRRPGEEEFPCLLNARILYDEHGEVIGMVEDFRDLTEQKRLEAVAEAVNTMNSIGYVFAGIRHELGNPINAIKTTLAVLLRKLDSFGKEEVQAYVERALGDISRVEFLLKSLRSYSMFESPQLEPVAVGPFVKNLLVLAGDDFRRSAIEIQSNVANEAECVYADPRALQQVMLNLMANAADALKERDDPWIKIETAHREQWFELVVSDNGCGMTERQQLDLFKPFVTNKPQGTGLGLVIVKKMLTRMGGTIAIQSETGVGTRVVMMLRAEPDEHA